MCGGKSRKRALPCKEQDLLNVVLAFLELDGRIAWAKRMNTGAAVRHYQDKLGRSKRHFVRFGFKGLSDILGQTADGRLLALETKRAGETATPEQIAFVDTVNRFGGVGAIVYSLEAVQQRLAQANITRRVQCVPGVRLR